MLAMVVGLGCITFAVVQLAATSDRLAGKLGIIVLVAMFLGFILVVVLHSRHLNATHQS
jgi:hypothetical protein